MQISKGLIAVVMALTVCVIVAAYVGAQRRRIDDRRVDSQPAYVRDAWISDYATMPNVSDEGAFVDQKRVIPVPDAAVRSAIDLLKNKESIELTSVEAGELLNGGLGRSFPKLRPYLVRAVTGDLGTEGTRVYVVGGAVIVSAGALSHYTVQLRHRPLIVYLNHAPKRVYVSYAAAE